MRLFQKGNADSGCWVDIGQDSPMLSGMGEFSARFLDEQTGATESVHDWRAAEVIAVADGFVLQGHFALPQLQAQVSVRVSYQIINEHVVHKKIALSTDRALKYWLSARIEALIPPTGYFTFEKDEFTGGPVYEIYPAMGMRFTNHSYGYLTDNGHRNRWTRVSRQADDFGFLVGLEMHSDAHLMTMAAPSERQSGRHYMEYKFGEVTDFTASRYEVKARPQASGWSGLSEIVTLETVTGETTWVRVSGDRSGSLALGEQGIAQNVVLEKNNLYEIYFRYRSNCPLAVRLLDTHTNSYFEWAREQGAYQDGIPASGENWASFGKKFITARFDELQEAPLLKLMVDPATDPAVDVADPFTFEITDFEIRKYEGTPRPYHTIEAGEERSLSLFVFEESDPHHRRLQIASQTRLAEGLGFVGSEWEKIFYADNQMLVWIAQHDDFSAHVVPSLNYHPDMYLRDAFWETQAVFDRAVSEECWSRYAQTQHEHGQLDTLARAYHYAPSADDNDATMFFIMWAYLNHVRYGSNVPMAPLQKALNNIRKNHCSDASHGSGSGGASNGSCGSQVSEAGEASHGSGQYISRTAGWFDTIWGQPTITAVNQGHFAVTLQCAKLLGLDVTDSEVEAAKTAYRALYHPEDGYVWWSREVDYVSPSVLMGEFMNLWLFQQPILSDEAVLGTVNKLPVMGRGVPCIADKNGRLFTDENKPWEPKYDWRQGVYHNGGSWFLYEYLAYAAGARHGWSEANERMTWRIEMELSKEDEPYSHEFIPLTEDEDDWWPTCRVFGWNTFALVAKQVADGKCEATLERKGR